MAFLVFPALSCPMVHGLASSLFVILKDPHLLNSYDSEALYPLQL